MSTVDIAIKVDYQKHIYFKRVFPVLIYRWRIGKHRHLLIGCRVFGYVLITHLSVELPITRRSRLSMKFSRELE